MLIPTIPTDDTHPLTNYINPLLGNANWTGQTDEVFSIRYFIKNSSPGYDAAVREALELWSNLTNLTFWEADTEDFADGITFQRYDLGNNILGGAGAGQDSETGLIINGDVILSNVYFTDDDTDFLPGSRGFNTLLHEIGHSLGLEHPDVQGASPYADAYPTAWQNDDVSLMIEAPDEQGPITSAYGLPATPQFADVAAIQYLYGANTSYNAGDTIYNFGQGLVQTLWDGAGTDIIDAREFTSSIEVDLREGNADYASTLGADAFWIAYGANIENIDAGSAADTLIGNHLHNAIRGFSGNDTITVGAGDDTVNGNQGNDEITGQTGDDFLRGGKDQDVITGNDGADFLNGNMGLDIVYGNTGDDTLHGGQHDDQLYGQTGNDVLFGDLGNDTLTGGDGADVFVFNSQTSGIDTITDFTSGQDVIELRNSSFSSATEVVSNFSNGVLTLDNGNSVILTGITELTETDVSIV